jgi:hypothetical protein
VAGPAMGVKGRAFWLLNQRRRAIPSFVSCLERLARASLGRAIMRPAGLGVNTELLAWYAATIGDRIDG